MKWNICFGQGILLHPVTLVPVTTQVVELEGFGRIGEWYDYSDSPEENIALISAAPDLLEACKKLVEYRRRNTLNFQLEKADDFINAMKNAIAKAEGQ